MKLSVLGEQPGKITLIISKYIEQSALRNPYGKKKELWKWPYLIYKDQKWLGKNTHKGRRISSQTSSRAIKAENMPKYYSIDKNVDLEGQIPRWEISAEDLKTFYDEATFERFLDWQYTEFVKPVGGRMSCKFLDLKRRITWLFPEDGLIFPYCVLF